MAGTCWGMRGVFFFSFFFSPRFSLLRGKLGERGGGRWDEGEGEVVLLRTALGRPRAGVNWGENGVEDLIYLDKLPTLKERLIAVYKTKDYILHCHPS